MTRSVAAVEACVEQTLRRVGKRVRLGTPLGIGKANHLVNEFYRRAATDPSIELSIHTALSLGRPHASSELERRFVEPLADRLFRGYPELAWVKPRREGRLPDNIRVREFYFQPGSLMGSPRAQRNHVSSNYTHVVRDLLDQDINVIAQLVAADRSNGNGEAGLRYSLGSNPDLTVDIVPHLERRRKGGEEIAILGQVNSEMPFMYGDAVVEPSFFDGVVDDPAIDFPLFGAPNVPVSTADYMIALHVGTLIRDGGTLQIGIGSMGDAITRVLQLRHLENETFRQVVADTGIEERYGDLVSAIGGLAPFEEGLYASSEMLVDGFLELRRSGVLRRRVYDSVPLQRCLNEGLIGEAVSLEALDALVDEGVIEAELTEADVAFLERYGLLRSGTHLIDGKLVFIGGRSTPADLGNDVTRQFLRDHGLGDRLLGGHFAHACFFLGPRDFYQALRSMDPAERSGISMTGISFVNELYGREELKRLQRRHARFVNSGIIATLGGAMASDGLEDGRVVSGVGGQYNFVAMAHELDDGRSILMLTATDERDGSLTSNIRSTYGHVTIPRHLRDIVVTEYGIADIRGRSDEDVVTALLEIADSRFQDELLAEAKEARRVPASYEIPEHARHNRPDRLEDLLAPCRDRGLFQDFPFGTDLTEEELVLKDALTALKRLAGERTVPIPGLSELRGALRVPEEATPYLRRMELENPSGLNERLLQRAVVVGLTSVGAI
ncbi:MAG: hypothetical protein EA350_06970 [Gemmatimonadales bacterium]|nr:MAG: hypothetical protein EA350_06970 [Gemmatimonadales bacterium]